MNSKFSKAQGFFLIELLISLIFVSTAALGIGLLLLQNHTLERQADWGYRAALSIRNGLEAHLISSLPSDITESQSWLIEHFPNSTVMVQKEEEKIRVKCLPPPGSRLKTLEFEF